MLDSIYHRTFRFLKKTHFGITQRYNGCHYVMLLNLLTTSGLSILLDGVISFPDATSCDNSHFGTQNLNTSYKKWEANNLYM